jgi:hypothetical protein
MRSDEGLSGDFDRTPMFTWGTFLKFPDDLELQREDERASDPTGARGFLRA